MAANLATFQDGFAHLLLQPGHAAGSDTLLDALVAQPGFAVYRNTVMKGCVDALQANYPAVARLVGEPWLRAAAAVFARASLPTHPTLLDYGEGFADFLHCFPPAAELPYLADVARLDRYWSEAHVAADAPVLDPAALAALDPQGMAGVGLRPHPAARWCWFAQAPVYSIWSRSRNCEGPIGELAWRGEGALLTRPFGEVMHVEMSRAGAAFLDACDAGHSIHGAVGEALAIDDRADLSALICQLLHAGAFTALAPMNRKETPR